MDREMLDTLARAIFAAQSPNNDSPMTINSHAIGRGPKQVQEFGQLRFNNAGESHEEWNQYVPTPWKQSDAVRSQEPSPIIGDIIQMMRQKLAQPPRGGAGKRGF